MPGTERSPSLWSGSSSERKPEPSSLCEGGASRKVSQIRATMGGYDQDPQLALLQASTPAPYEFGS